MFSIILLVHLIVVYFLIESNYLNQVYLLYENTMKIKISYFS